MAEKYPITTWMPTYEETRQILRVLEGESYSKWLSMKQAISAVIWLAENKGKFVDPEIYIPELLPAEDQDLAYRIWREAHAKPHMAGTSVSLAQLHNLVTFAEERIALTEAGNLFLQNDDSTIAKIDQYEGILSILHYVAERGPGGESLFLETFREFLHRYTTFSTNKSGFQVLRTRLINLRHRDLIEKLGKNYQVTDAGIAYIGRRHISNEASTYVDKPESGHTEQTQTQSKLQLTQLISQQYKTARQQLRECLQTIDPFQFEHLIKHLLEEMGYENVEVTGGSKDGGVDVVGEIQLGISRVREVVQAKRYTKGNVTQPDVLKLRGSILLFGAVRGSIITTAGFSSGAKEAAIIPGAAPITLIDGETLLDLLIENGIGIRWREIRYLEFEPDSLVQFEPVDSEFAQ